MKNQLKNIDKTENPVDHNALNRENAEQTNLGWQPIPMWLAEYIAATCDAGSACSKST